MYNIHAEAKLDSTEASRFALQLYLAVEAEVMLTSNLWSEVGLHNGDKGKVVYFIYKGAAVPRSNGSKDSPLDVIFQIYGLAYYVKNIQNIPHGVATIIFKAELKVVIKNFMR